MRVKMLLDRRPCEKLNKLERELIEDLKMEKIKRDKILKEVFIRKEKIFNEIRCV